MTWKETTQGQGGGAYGCVTVTRGVCSRVTALGQAEWFLSVIRTALKKAWAWAGPTRSKDMGLFLASLLREVSGVPT